ncbi:MAG: hypothetical protein IT372_03390, partial [Polyangiaceae bacterium]|nr:hypothetical protein [Polyangiaceae bacterium]
AADDARARLAADEAEAAAAQRAEQEARAEIARLREHAAGLAAEGARLREHAAGSAAEGARLREHAASLAAEGARLREEIAALRLTAQEAERRARAAEAGLRASDSGTQRTEATRFAPAPPALTAAAPTGAALDAPLARVLAAGRARSIVLADGEGLLVSAAGDARHHEPLAALWGAIADVARRACEHLPFGAVRAREIVDDRGRVLTSRAVDHGPSGLAVTALSDGGQRPQPELEASLAPISQTLKLERRRGA